MSNTHVYQFDPQFVTGTVKGVDGSGNNAAGSDLVLTGGNSTGAGAGGDLVFKTAPAVTVNPLAAQFVSSSSQSLSRADNTDLSTGNVDWWASGWVWFDTVGINDNILTKYDQNISADREFHFATSTSSFFAMAYQTTAGGFLVTATAFGAPSVSTWYYWLVWNDATNKTINIRLNNGTVFSTTYTGTGQDGTVPFRLGATVRNGAPEAFLNGRLDEVSFGKSPSGGIASVISTISGTLYNSGAGILFTDVPSATQTAWGAVSAWALDEASGTRADSVGSNALTANNAPANNTGKVIPMGTSANALTERARITGAGLAGIGTAAPSARLQVNAGTSTVIGAVLKGAASQSADLTQWQNSSGTVLTSISSAGLVNAFAGFSDAVNVLVGSTTGTRIGTAATQKIGFWNAVPVVQPASTGTTVAGFTANASANALFAESTFTGNVGSTAYTASDVVKNLKAAGILAA